MAKAFDKLIAKVGDPSMAVAIAMQNLCKETYMSKAKLSYIVVKTSKTPDELKDIVPNYEFWPTNAPYWSLDCLLFSLIHDRYSYNCLEDMTNAPINMHLCDSMEDFVAYIEAHSIGTNLSNLWSKL